MISSQLGTKLLSEMAPNKLLFDVDGKAVDVPTDFSWLQSYCEAADAQSYASDSKDRRSSPVNVSYFHGNPVSRNAKHDDRPDLAHNARSNFAYNNPVKHNYRQNHSNGYGSQESNGHWDYEEDDCYDYKSDFEFASFVREEERYPIDEEERWRKHADEVAHLADEFDRIRLPDERHFDRHIQETKKVEPQWEEIDDLQKYTEKEIIDFIRLHPRSPYTDTREHDYDPRPIAEQLMDDVDKPIGPMPRHRSMSVDIFERDVTAPGTSHN
ncbi:hypothetical protein M3Y94_00713000 [Aphelenchoides besseyi]|nr:hypothetical protein M3Y94_00713000 [Aphelenchoides besseyi]